METITETAKGFPRLISEQYPNIKVTTTYYLSIDENNIVKTSSYPYNLEEAKIVLVMCFYEYTVITQKSSSNFFLFMDQSGWREDYYMIDGWKIEFGRPIISGYHTEGRKCKISKENLKAEFYLRPGNMSYTAQIQKLWPYLMEIIKSKTQKELDYIRKAFESNIVIDELKAKIQNLEHLQMTYNEQVTAYKHATPTT